MVGMIEVTMEWSDEDWDPGILLTPLGENRYRLDIDPDPLRCVGHGERMRRARVKDVIEAQLMENGRLRFVRVVERARLKRSAHIVGRAVIDSPHFDRALQTLTDLGGYWELIAGGYLILYLPRDCDHDFWADFERMQAEGQAP